jgi:hypothetical protein
MTAPILTFLEAQATKILALVHDNQAEDGTVKYFRRCWISPGVDYRRLLRVPNFPTVLLNDEGGGPHSANHLIELRQFSATVFVLVPADHVGEKAEKTLLDLIDVLLWGDGANPGIGRDVGNAVVEYWDSGVSSVVTTEGAMIVSKQLNFPYELARAPEAENEA